MERMKTKWISGILVMSFCMMLVCFPASAKEKANGPIDLEITNRSSELENVTVTLEKATAERMSQPDRYEYTLSGSIENDSDEGIMQVIYSFAFFDENGEEFRSFAEVYDGEDEVIPPHTVIPFSHDNIKWGAQSVPSSVAIEIDSVKTETELPPVRLPEKGNYLYEVFDDANLENIKNELPVEIAFHIDQGGYGRTATFEKGAQLDQAVELFCAIKIADEVDEWVTDNYNWISLVWEDGSESYISLNLRNLEYPVHSNIHVYALENLGKFWSYAENYLKEDE